ncbi:MAG: hypothetical protein LBC13_01860 [Clostridiales bacterium]|jgi:hypothetical protein|nr:hypothetical protein [Clostridiales bacterium]
MSKAKPQIKWLILFVLFMAAALCFTVYRDIWLSGGAAPAASVDDGGVQPETPDAGGDESGGADDAGDGGETHPAPVPDVYYSVLPRAAIMLSDGSLYQHAGGTGSETLKAVHPRGDGKTAVVLETSSNGYDFTAAAPSVGAALFSDDALDAVLTLDAGESYLDSAMGGFGLFIAAKGEGYIKHYAISHDLGSVTKLTLGEGKDAAYLPGGGRSDGAYLTVLSGNSLSLRYVSADGDAERLGEYALSGAESIKSVYEYANGAAVFTNGTARASVTVFNFTGGATVSKSFNNTEFLQIMTLPIKIDSFKFGFVFLSRSEGKLKLMCVSETLSLVHDEILNLTSARLSRLTNEKGFLLIGGGSAAYYCEHLERNFILNASAADGDIADECDYAGGKLFAVRKEYGITLILYSGGTFTAVKTVDGVRNVKIYGGANRLLLFGEVYGRIYENFGDGDVFYMGIGLN